jgi:hypothetical protein
MWGSFIGFQTFAYDNQEAEEAWVLLDYANEKHAVR